MGGATIFKICDSKRALRIYLDEILKILEWNAQEKTWKDKIYGLYWKRLKIGWNKDRFEIESRFET